MEEMGKVYNILVGNPGRTKPLRKPCSWDDTIKKGSLKN
jgi:hypothetical protein